MKYRAPDKEELDYIAGTIRPRKKFAVFEVGSLEEELELEAWKDDTKDEEERGEIE